MSGVQRQGRMGLQESVVHPARVVEQVSLPVEHTPIPPFIQLGLIVQNRGPEPARHVLDGD